MAEPIFATVAVRHPLPFAYGVAADVVRWPAFWPSCRRVAWLSGSGPGGEIALVLGSGLLRRLALQGRLTVSPGRIRFDGDGGGFWFELSLSDEGSGTLVCLSAAPPPSGLVGAVGSGAVWRRAMDELLPALRRRLDDLAWLPTLASERPEPSLLRLARG